MRSMIEGAVRPILCAAGCVLICAPAMALSPVKGEVGAVYWSNQTDATSAGASTSTDSGAPGLRGDLWVLDRYGVRAGQYRSDAEGGMDSTSIDVMWRAFAPSANNYLAIGLGWQDLQLHNADVDSDTSGMRLAVEGHLGFTDLIEGYGQGAWLPRLGDASGPSGQLQDMDGYEYEMGVAWSAAPFLRVRAGWRTSTVGFTEGLSQVAGSSNLQVQTKSSGIQQIVPTGPGGGQQGQSVGSSSGTSESKGWFFGLGFRF